MGDGVYGVTANGFVLKRLDSIIDDIYNRLADPQTGWGIDPRIASGQNLNSQSALNVLVTSFSNEVSALWEVAQDNYYSMYPNTSEGINLDNAVQFGGMRREPSAVSIYLLSCTGDDGTAISYGKLVQSTVQPIQNLQSMQNQTISSNDFRAVKIGTLTVAANSNYIISINGINCTYVSKTTDTAVEILNGLAAAIMSTTILFTATVDTEALSLTIAAVNAQSSNALVLSTNLQVLKVTSNLIFGTLDYGDIYIPLNTITKIVSTITGWDSVNNDIDYTAGRQQQTDVALRQSYINRIEANSNNMIGSIIDSLYNDVNGVASAIGVENDTDEVDAYGNKPHSIWIIVDGGEQGNIAQVIFTKKAGGINTNGAIQVPIADGFGNIQMIKFDRPIYKYTWLKVILTPIAGKSLPTNYAQLAQNTIMSGVSSIAMGQSIYVQQFYNSLFSNINNLALVQINAALTDSAGTVPTDYPLTNISIDINQKALFNASRIEVLLG